MHGVALHRDGSGALSAGADGELAKTGLGSSATLVQPTPEYEAIASEFIAYDVHEPQPSDGR